MRFSVEVDVTKLLQLGVFHKCVSTTSWVQFCYKHLANLCYRYGKLGQLLNSCTTKVQVDLSQTNAYKDLYGP